MSEHQDYHPLPPSGKSNRWLTYAIVVVLLLVSVLASFFAYAAMRRWKVASHTRKPVAVQLTPHQSSTAPIQSQTTSPALPSPTAAIPEPTLAAWDGVGRVTILLLGLDYRDWEAGSEASRSDTMILLTLDPLAQTAGILSIPRDMWVAIPGFQHGKINTAYYLGDAYKLPGGGPGLAVDTVEQFLGVPVNFYAQIDFQAFVRFIDKLGGVKVNIPAPITVDLLGSGARTKKTLQPGVQVLPGEWALAYARARHTDGGDFDRAKRQQQVILGIRDRILSFELLPYLITNAGALFQELSAGIRTNLTIDQVVRLALLASKVPDGNIQQGVIDEKYILFGRSPDNLAILIPLIDKINLLRDELFANTTVLSPLTPGDAQAKAGAEAARVEIINASTSPGLAERTAEYLRAMGVNVVGVAEANSGAINSSLVDHSGKPFTSTFLMEQIGIAPLRFSYAFDPVAQADLTLTLGEDWARVNPLP